MEKTPEQTANATTPRVEAGRFSVPKLSVPTLSHPRLSASKAESAQATALPDQVEQAAAEPEDGESAAEPEATVEPDTTVEPEAAVEPEATAEPEEAVEPDTTVEPEAAVEPEATVETTEAAIEVAVEPDDPTSAAPKSWSKRLGLAIALPKVSLPKLNMPKVTMPKVTLPKLRLPKVALAALALGRGSKAGETPAEATAVKLAPAKSNPAKTALVKSAPTQATLVKSPASVKTPVVAAKRRPRGKPSTVLLVKGLTKRFDETVAVDSVDLEVKAGAFYGIVGPNGAGKTTTLSMITGLLRPDAGTVSVNGADVWSDPVTAKRNMGVLPDRLRLFDRLTGAQLLYYAGVLRGMDSHTVRERSADLASAFGLEAALGRLVSDYSAGMTKKIALAAAMIHSPRLLVLDEPFESVDPVSAATVTDILKKYAAEGGTVLLSSHSMDLVQRICDNVAVVVGGSILADGTMAAVRDGHTLEERFVELAGGRKTVEGLEWLHSFSD